VFRAGSGGGRDLYAIRNVPDAEPVPLAVSEFEEYSPTLSADGKWLAYGSDESGRSEVYVRPFPDASSGRWQVSREGGTEPLWGPEGRILFYRRGERGDLIRVQVAAGDAFRVTTEEVLFPTLEYQTDTRNRNWDISPDGESFYFILETPVGEARQVMVLNWFEELEQMSGGQ
jgi:serine/threonine-protein kinase